MFKAELYATITIKPTAPPVLWYNLYKVPPEIRTRQAIKELEKVIEEVGNERTYRQQV